MSQDALKAIHSQVMWNRLIAVVEEQAQALLRAAFGSVVREAGDLSAGVYDTEGRMLAQAVTGTPGHVNTMAMAVAHFLERFAVADMRPGEVFVTNDPWMGTGHLFDYVVVTPAFHEGRPVALFASTCHVLDVGGRGFSADATSVYEEGVLIPHMRLRGPDGIDEKIMAIICANSRNPREVRGDLSSLIACNDTGARRLADMMGEFALTDLDELAEHILTSSERAMRAAIKEMPDGRHSYEMPIDGYEAPITLKATTAIEGDRVLVDYAGTSPASRYGINSPKCYTDAYTAFALKCVIAPEVPNNAGSLGCFDITAQAGSCVAPERPSAVTARHVIGQMIPDVVFGCLAKAKPDAIQAESAGSIWVLAMQDGEASPPPGANAPPQRFNVMNVGLGGVGARPGKDGFNTTAFPSGVGTIPVEVTETEAPLVFWRKELLADSGGAGAYRGGLGQIIEIGHRDEAGFLVSAATWDRLKFAAGGRAGGHPGTKGAAYLDDGTPVEGKHLHAVPAGRRITVELPGGGGYGDPAQRDKAAIQADLDAGYVTPDYAARFHGGGD
jgi:N-methylhydantoinase B